MSVIAENQGLIRKAVSVVMPRALLTRSLVYEDLVQEASHAFLYAEQKYRSDGGSKLSTYLYISMINRLNRVVDRALHRERFEFTMTANSDDGEQDGLDQFLDALAESDDLINPELMVEQLEHYQHTLRDLSPLARRVVRLMAEPSEKMRQMISQKTHRNHAGYPQLTGILRLLAERGLSRERLNAVRSEILALPHD